MANYAFEATNGATGGLLMGVEIVHDPAVCAARGIPCNVGRMRTVTDKGGLATMSLPGDEWHYFTATKPPYVPIATNAFTVGMNRVRYMEFIF